MFRAALFTCLATIAMARSFEDEALAISRNIQARHLPFGTVLDPIFSTTGSQRIVGYTRCGDSAIWTGHYLAAESFRYAVTKTPESLQSAKAALRGLKFLVDVTGSTNVLARCALPVGDRFSRAPRKEERSHGIFRGTADKTDWEWIGNTSRDQYLGVFFGLSIAYDHLIEDRPIIKDMATRLLARLVENDWSVVMPNGDISTVFWHRPDQQLAMLQVGRQVNAPRFAKAYEDLRRSALLIGLPISLEGLSPHDSYFKFNLDAVSLYTLLRLEEESSRRGDYVATYRSFRSIVAGHGNAFFNVIDLALTGADMQRDTETARLMTQWLQRPRRDPFVDLRGKYKACDDDRACEPIPLPERVTTDFLWQRSPFLLFGGGAGLIEGPGIDFILPYWMARYYGMDFSPLTVDGAKSNAIRIPIR